MQTSLKSVLAFVHSDVKNAFSQSPQYICVHQQGDRDTDVSGNVTTIYGTLPGGVADCRRHSWNAEEYNE